jgi:plasmid maintenance system antidote protein VapI
MRNPHHPDGFGFRECIQPRRLSITEAASALRVMRAALSKLITGTPDTFGQKLLALKGTVPKDIDLEFR